MSQNRSNSSQNDACHDDSEISLLDILIFLKKSGREILGAGFLGLVVSSVFLIITPNQYEAVTNIQMARVPTTANPLGVNVEEPVALIARMSLPTSFNETVLTACGLLESTKLANQLVKTIKLSIPKGVASVVELKVTRPTPELAKTCAVSVVDLIAQTQAAAIAPMTDATKTINMDRLARVEERLAQDKGLLAKAEQPKGPISPAYFAILSEIRALEDERESLSKTSDAKALQGATVQSPIYSADNPIYPKKMIALGVGLLGGLFFGLLLAIARKVIINIRMQLVEFGVIK